jgi:hypothetical protein
VTEADPAPASRPFPGSTVAGGVLATLFFPVLSLIAALVLMGRETDESRRASLRAWAWFSGVWIGAQLLFGLILLASFNSATAVDRSGPCQGGPEIGAAGETRLDGTTVFPCSLGGTVTVQLPPLSP